MTTLPTPTSPPPDPEQPDSDTLQRSAERLWPTLMRARLAVAGVLLALQGMILLLGSSTSLVSLGLCALHLVAVLAASHRIKPALHRGLGYFPWAMTVGVDLLVFAGLQALQLGGLNYTLLFALPVLMSSILGPQQRGLATAALVTLFMLVETAWTNWFADGGTPAKLFQAAITGTGFFLVALLARQLAIRLAREEALSEHSQLAARTQVVVNELIIDTMTDGVLVVDGRGMVRTANPAARHMLGDEQGPAPSMFLLGECPHCTPLSELVQSTFDRHEAQQGEVLLQASPDHRRRLRVRSRPADSSTSKASDAASRLCVVFLEDLYELEARVRSEKLAGMGRMSVAVAHEIRNPLSAIAQANELLIEDMTDPQHLRLAHMVASHTRRLNRIVDDVLNVVRVPSQPAPADTPVTGLDASVLLHLDEWRNQHAHQRRVSWQAGCGDAEVRFDTEHLRRVLVNLLDNASRYASSAPEAIRVSTRPEADGMLRLSVWSDGAPLDQSVKRHLFEPFFSSESRSSGMGLYLCRELCDRYHAQLDYQRVERHDQAGNEFFVLIPSATAETTA